jgi:hypothetical protein
MPAITTMFGQKTGPNVNIEAWLDQWVGSLVLYIIFRPETHQGNRLGSHRESTWDLGGVKPYFLLAVPLWRLYDRRSIRVLHSSENEMVQGPYVTQHHEMSQLGEF